MRAPLQEVMQRGVERIGRMWHERFDRQSLQPEETLFVTSEDVVAEGQASGGAAAAEQALAGSSEGRLLLRALRALATP